MQWSLQYGRPGTLSASQKQKPGLPGWPIGQQQRVTRVPSGRTDGGGGGAGRRSVASGSAGVAVTSAGAELSEGSGGRLGGGRGAGRSFGGEPLRIGEGRSGKSRRCALPTTAFLLKPKRRPISAVLWPSTQSERSRPIATSFQSKLLVMSFSWVRGRRRACAIAQSQPAEGSTRKCCQG